MIFDAEFFHAINQILSVLGWRGRQDAVAEIEDMPRTRTETFEYACRFVPYLLSGTKKHARVKVSLNRFSARLVMRFSDVFCPIYPENITFYAREFRSVLNTLSENNYRGTISFEPLAYI